jgi:hypothetical protein
MKEIKLNDGTKLKMCTDVKEITYTELDIFQKYFGQILWNVDEKNLDSVIEKTFTYIDDQKISKAMFLLDNFRKNLKIQQVGLNAWMMCFAILVKKENPIFNEDELLELFRDFDKKGIDKELLEEVVVNFTKAFPITHNIYSVKKEGLDILTQIL